MPDISSRTASGPLNPLLAAQRIAEVTPLAVARRLQPEQTERRRQHVHEAEEQTVAAALRRDLLRPVEDGRNAHRVFVRMLLAVDRAPRAPM